ncbi:MAG: hypothetical protein ACOCX3_02980 [Chloroflexota bacterium]
MKGRRRILNVYEWIEKKGSLPMTLFPNRTRSTGILRLLDRARRSVLHQTDEKPGIPKPARQPSADAAAAKPSHENEYFTFSKDGELINLDDDEVIAREREIEAKWRKAYLEEVNQRDDQQSEA